MQKLSEQLNTPSLYSLLCRVSRGDFLPFIDPLEANAVREICGELGIGIVACRHPKLKIYLEEIDGLDLLNIKDKGPSQLQLPQYIPVIDSEFFDYDADTIKYNVVGVSLEDIFTSQPRKYMGKLRVGNLKIKKGLLDSPIFQNKKVVLFSSGPDVLIENLWPKRDELNLFSELARMGFFLITGMNFSIFFEECPVGHAINLKKSLKYFSLLQEFKATVIPHICWAHIFHLQRWVEWLKANPNINFVTINCQRYSLNDYLIVQEGIQYLRRNIGREIHFLLEGPRQELLKVLTDHSSLIHIAIKRPSMDAKFYWKYILDQRSLKKTNREHGSKDKLLESNIQIFHSFLQKTFFKKFALPVKAKQNRNVSQFLVTNNIIGK